MLRIALTKGRILEKAITLFERAGYNVEEIKNSNANRKLIFEIEDKYQIVLAKSGDVVTFTARGACDIGVVGKDTLMEMNATVAELVDLGFGRCCFAVAAKMGAEIFNITNRTLCVGTKYPKVAREYFNNRGIDAEIVKIEGSVELAPLLGVADCIVDIVESGATLKANGLEVVEVVAPVSARLIANIGALQIQKQEINGLIKLLIGDK